MKTEQPSAFSDQPSAPALNTEPTAAPARPEFSYDFFGNSELLISPS